MTEATRTCAVCGRAMTPRKRWRGSYDEVKYCSKACRRRRGLSDIDRRLEATIVELVERRGPGKTICPSEAARAVAPDDDAWRALMEQVRQAARRMVARGELEITQRGRVVDPSTAKGPIRLRRPR